jgi:hypothetical protein
MTAKPSDGWPAQRPSDDFASRTVAAILRDRAAAPKRGRRARWLGAIGVAAVLVAAGAWARVALPKGPATQPSRVQPVGSGIAAPAAPEPVKSTTGSAASPARAPAPAASARRPRPPSRAPDPGRQVRVPMCNCVQQICDCGEER